MVMGTACNNQYTYVSLLYILIYF